MLFMHQQTIFVCDLIFNFCFKKAHMVFNTDRWLWYHGMLMFYLFWMWGEHWFGTHTSEDVWIYMQIAINVTLTNPFYYYSHALRCWSHKCLQNNELHHNTQFAVAMRSTFNEWIFIYYNKQLLIM